jgi:hypothetical protein
METAFWLVGSFVACIAGMVAFALFFQMLAEAFIDSRKESRYL